MAGRQLRFVHASDLHLEQPLHGIVEVPDHLRNLFLDAALTAAKRLFDTVLEEGAELLVLSGDVIHQRAVGARGMDFLHAQFERLREAKVPVYWADSPLDDAEHWPAAASLPPNVRVFGADHVERAMFRRDGQRDVAIYGRGGNTDESVAWDEVHHNGDAYAIAVAHSEIDFPVSKLSESIDYWAIGGPHNRQTLRKHPVVHAPGTHQGRCPMEQGPHGCAVVDVDDRGKTHRHTVTTDVLRWHRELIDLPDHVDVPGLLRLMSDRAHHLTETMAGRQMMVEWVLTDGDQTSDTRSDLLAARLRQGELEGELLDTMRQRFGQSVPGIWSISIQAEPPTVLPSGWYEEDTVLGDLLRSVQQYQQDPHLEITLEPVPERVDLVQELRQQLTSIQPQQRDLLLRQVAILGVDLLRGDRILSEE